jgi:hypothetical protein
MKKLIFLLSLFCIILVTGCNKNEDKNETVVFDESHPYAISPDVEWAVITEPYVGFHEESNRISSSNSYCRKGEILQIRGYSINEEHESWYLFDKGWIPSSSLTVYSNRYKAEAAVKQFSSK